MSEDWDPTIAALNALVEQWDIISDYEDPPSDRLAANATDQRDLSLAVVTTLEGLRTDPATRNATASSYLEAVIRTGLLRQQTTKSLRTTHSRR